MYRLYIWNPWSFGRWIYSGEFATKKEVAKQIKNKRETTYKITKNDSVVEFHEAQGYCWRNGMVRPRLIMKGRTTMEEYLR